MMSDDGQGQASLSSNLVVPNSGGRKRKLNSLDADGSTSPESGSVSDNKVEQVMCTLL